jgi:hypothetical protein
MYLNYLIYFSTDIRCLKRVSLSSKKDRILAIGEENIIRIYDADNGNHITVVMPIPNVVEKSQILATTYSRKTNSFYVLLENNELWVYFTK